MRALATSSGEVGMRAAITFTIVALLLSVAVAVPSAAAAPARPFDFNGDGYGDLAVGAPLDDVGGARDAGSVTVLYGGANGTSAAGDQLWSQDSAGIAGAAERGDRFGKSLASADFDRDGYADLAVGAPGESNAASGSGVVHVLFGSTRGLAAAGDQLLQQGTNGLVNARQAFDAFGVALVAADFSGDGFPDLVVGVPGQDVSGIDAAGAVHFIKGSAGGLSTAGDRMISQDTAGVRGSAATRNTGDWSEYPQFFGASLAAGRLDGDRYADLAIGVPGEPVNYSPSAGVVHVLYGSGVGPSADRDQLWHQGIYALGENAESPESLTYDLPPEEFGRALAVGDFGNGGHDDLVIGVPGEVLTDRACNPDDGDWDEGGSGDEPPGSCRVGGAVHVLFGSADGVTAAHNEFWHPDSEGLAGSRGGRFGWALDAGDVAGSAHDDLAVGAPRRAAGGGVSILRGSPTGLTTTGNQLWTQNISGVPDTGEADDAFGASVRLVDLGRSTAADLLIGIPGEDFNGHSNAGRVQVLYSGPEGPATAGNHLWSRAIAGVAGEPAGGDQLGTVR